MPLLALVVGCGASAGADDDWSMPARDQVERVHDVGIRRDDVHRAGDDEPKPEAFAQGIACCDVVNRGLAYTNGRLFFNTLDNQTIALDAGSFLSFGLWVHHMFATNVPELGKSFFTAMSFMIAIPTADGDEAQTRRRFTAGLALASSALSALVIAAMWLAVFVIAPCIA